MSSSGFPLILFQDALKTGVVPRNIKHSISNTQFDPAVMETERALQLASSSGANPEVVHAIESVLKLVKLREDFAVRTTSKGSSTMNEITEETNKHDWEKVYKEGKSIWMLHPVMLSGRWEGQFMKSLISIQKAKRILEIGMFTGYTALAMAEALPADGEVVSIDREEYLKSLVTDLVKSSPHHKKIKIVIGKALEVMKDMADRGEKFDIIFLDADKDECINYFKLAFDGGLLNPNGTVLVDNAFFFGDGYLGDTPTKRFADALIADTSLHKVLVPIKDGTYIVRRLSDVEVDVHCT